MVMLAPNTARPTMTVSMPLSRIDDSNVVTAPARPDADEPSSAAVEASSPLSDPELPGHGQRPDLMMSPRICAITTTTVVSPSVALGSPGYRRQRR